MSERGNREGGRKLCEKGSQPAAGGQGQDAAMPSGPSEGWAERGLEKEQGVPSAGRRREDVSVLWNSLQDRFWGDPLVGLAWRPQGRRPSRGTGFSSTGRSAGALSQL